MLRRLLTYVVIYCVASAVYFPIILLNAYPKHPRTHLGWLLLAILAAPLAFAGELVGESLSKNRVTREIPSDKDYWPARMFYLLVGMVAMVVACLVMGHYLSKLPL
jgi:uncharacterized membrane protein